MTLIRAVGFSFFAASGMQTIISCATLGSHSLFPLVTTLCSRRLQTWPQLLLLHQRVMDADWWIVMRCSVEPPSSCAWAVQGHKWGATSMSAGMRGI